MTRLEGVRDARKLQLELLKFEVRTLRPFAKAVLDPAAACAAKRSAIAMVAAGALALQPATAAFAGLVGDGHQVKEGASVALAQFIDQCDSLRCLIDAGAVEGDLFSAVRGLFETVEREHARLEAIANTTSTKILWGDGAQAVGTGRKDPPSAWLVRAFSHFGR